MTFMCKKSSKKKAIEPELLISFLKLTKKTGLIKKKGMTVVDLGSAPGSWSQVAGQLVGDAGTLIASDILPMDTLENVIFYSRRFS